MYKSTINWQGVIKNRKAYSNEPPPELIYIKYT